MEKYYVDPDIAIAETLPASFYRSEEVFELMKEKIFAKSWQWLGDERDLLPLTGSVYPMTLLDHFLTEPIVLVKDPNTQVRCFSNVCTHRGNIIVHHPGLLSRLTCGYHGRRWGLDGQLQFMPEFKEVEHFPRPCDHLHQFDIGQLGPHLFVGLDGTFPFSDILYVMLERIGFLPLEEFKTEPKMHKDYLVNCHWALYCDNYLEGFHIPFVHSDLNNALDYGSYTTEVYKYVNLQIGYAEGGEHVFNLPEGHIDHGKNVAAYYYWIFPNMMFNFYPWGLSVNVVKPVSINKTRVSFRTYVYDEKKLGKGAGALLDKVEREDEFVVEGVHKGLQSRFYNTGRFSVKREQGVHHFHRLLAEWV